MAEQLKNAYFLHSHLNPHTKFDIFNKPIYCRCCQGEKDMMLFIKTFNFLVDSFFQAYLILVHPYNFNNKNP